VFFFKHAIFYGKQSNVSSKQQQSMIPPINLTLANLAFERHYHFLFEQIQSIVNAGEILQIQGANGSGKSTLLRIVVGLIEPSVGTVLWQGKSIFQNRDHYQQQLHYIGHQNGIKPHLTVYENLQLTNVLATQQLSSPQLLAIIEQVGLLSVMHRLAWHLSSGQLRRISLARLLLVPRALWVLDEPMTSLDAEGQQLLVDLLRQHVTAGGIVVLASHHALLLTAAVKTIMLRVNREERY
jgi:heme exporter protein A